MESKHYNTIILKNCLKYSIKNYKIILLTLILEYILIYIESISAVSRILLKLNIITQNFSISKYNPVGLFTNLKNSNCDTQNNCQYPDILFYITLIIILLPIFIFFFLIVYETKYNSSEAENFKLKENSDASANNLNFNSSNTHMHLLDSSTSKKWKIILAKFLKSFCINFLDFIGFKILGLYVLNITFDRILFGINNTSNASGSGSSIFFLIIGVIFAYLYLYCYIFLVENLNLMVQFNPKLTFHYDHKFSKKYDYMLLFLKIVIVLENNFFSRSLKLDDISAAENSETEKILFFDIIILSSIFTFTFKIVYELISNETIFYINKKFNTVRLFLLFINSLTFFTILIFVSSIERSIFLIIVIVSIFIFSIIAILVLTRMNPNPVFYKERYIPQLIEIIHDYFTLSTEQFNNKIIKIHGIHVNYCITKTKTLLSQEFISCFICGNVNIEQFPKNFIAQTKILVKKKILTLTREEKFYFKFAKLICAERGWLGDIEEKSLIYKTKLLVERKKFSDKNFLSNLTLFFDYINVYDRVNEIKFNLIKKLDETNHLINSSIEKLQEVFLLFDSNSKKDFYLIALALNKNKKEILKSIQYFMINKNVYVDMYSLIIMRYNFEKLYNMQLGDSDQMYDIENQEDSLNEFFFKDKIINMIYNIKNNHITIFKASKQFVNYRKKNFEEIFPKNFRKYGTQNFLASLKKHYEGFNYEYVVQADNYFVSNIKLTSSLLKSVNLEELMIISKFESTREDLLIFQELYNDREKNSKNNDYLITFSPALCKVFFLHPKWLETLKKFHIHVMLSLNKIFEKNYTFVDNTQTPSNSNDAQKENFTKEVFVLNYNDYYNNIYSKLIKYIKEYFDSDPLSESFQLEIERLAKVNYHISARINYKYLIYNNDGFPCHVYSLKLYRQKRGEFTQLGNDSNNPYTKGINDSIYRFEEEESERNFDRELSQCTFSSVSSLSKEAFSTLYTKKEVEKKTSNLNKFTLATLLINIFLVIYCIIFLTIGLMDNKHLNELNDSQIVFKKFQSDFLNTALSIYMNVGLYYPGSNDYSDYPNEDYRHLLNINSDIQIDLMEYILKELSVKVDLLKTDLLNFQNYIHKSKFAEELEAIMLKDSKYYTISQIGNDWQISANTASFSDMMNILMTNGKSSNLEKELNLIYIFNFDANTKIANFSNVYNRTISDSQRTVYELVMNYPTYLKNFKILENFTNSISDQTKNEIFFRNLYLTFALIGLHILLIVISIVIINHLKKSTFDHNKFLFKTITPDVSKYMQTKLIILKDLNEFYIESPSKLVKKLKALKKDYMVKFENIRKKEKSHHLDSFKKDNSKNSMHPMFDKNEKSFYKSNSKIKIEKLLKPLIRLLFFLFLIYYLYAFLFFLGFYFSFNDLIAAYDYLNLSEGINNEIMNNAMLHQTIQFSNQTDAGITKFLFDNDAANSESTLNMNNHDNTKSFNFGVTNFNFFFDNNSGYIKQSLEVIKLMNMQLMKIQKSSKKYSNIKTQMTSAMNCNELYANTDDEIIKTLITAYPSGVLQKSLQAYCLTFPFMQKNDSNSIIYDVNYSMMKLVQDFESADGDYLKIKRIFDQDIYLEMKAIITLIFRPVESYVLNSILIPLIKNVTSSYLLIIIFYLICNIFVDIIIFIVIKQKLIKKVNEIDDDIKCLLECISG